MEASWAALEKKALLYDQLQEGMHDVDDNEDILVDFLSKTMESQDCPAKKKARKTEPVVANSSIQAAGWTQITDEFGRSRLVRVEEAEALQAAAAATRKKELEQALQEEQDNRYFDTANPMDLSNQGKSANLHFDSKREKRNLGVGFYQFDQDQDKRRQQFEDIEQLRNDTIDSRTKLAAQKEKRREKNEGRLEKLKDRARKRKLEQAEKTAEDFLGDLLG